ncbi:hypothetical protein FRC07_000865 [Ceratobasidium sp. 392]|nr:hypothetical protein FRC07_000865 [Ceratobasidium sp. 392]
MPDRTYTRPVKTTSMTVSDRRELNERKKMLKKGIIPPPKPPKETLPRRSGLRQRKLTFPAGGAPEIVDPNKSKAKAQQALQIQIPVTRLPGQADIPGSDSPERKDFDLAAGYALLTSSLATGPSGLTPLIPNPVGSTPGPDHAPTGSAPVALVAPSVALQAVDPIDPVNNRSENKSPEIEDGEDKSSSNSDQDAEGEDESDDSDKGNQVDHLRLGTGSNTSLMAIPHLAVAFGNPASLVLPPLQPFPAHPSGPAINIQVPHPFGPPSEPIAPVFMDIPADVQDLLLNAPIPFVDDSMPGLAFNHLGLQAMLTDSGSYDSSSLVGAAHQEVGIPTATSGRASNGLLEFAASFATSVPQHMPLAAPPLVQQSLQSSALANSPDSVCTHMTVSVPPTPFDLTPGPRYTSPAPPPRVRPPLRLGAPVASSPSHARAHTPLQASAVTHRASHQLLRMPINPTSRAGTPFTTTRSTPVAPPITPLRATSTLAPKPSVSRQPGLDTRSPSAAIRQVQAQSRSHSATASIGPPSSHSRHSSVAQLNSSPALRATTSRSLTKGPSPGHRLAANPAAVGSPARVRSASPRLSAPSTPLGRSSSFYTLPQFHAVRSLCSASRAGSSLPSRIGSPVSAASRTELEGNFPSTPRTEIDRNLPFSPRTEIGIDEDLPLISSAETRSNQVPSTPLDEDMPLAHNQDPVRNLDSTSDVDSTSHAESRIADSLGVPRLRTPPPLARALQQSMVTPESDFENSDGFFVPGPVPNTDFSMELVPSVTIAAPTSTEFALYRARELIDLQVKKKTKTDPDGGQIKGARKVCTYDAEHKKLMNVMKGSMQYQFTSISPWMISDNNWYAVAKDFAREYTNLVVDGIDDSDFLKSLKMSSSQVRGAALEPVKTLVQKSFGLEAGDEAAIKWLQDRGRCLYPGYNMQGEDKFNTVLMSKVMVAMYFHSVRRIAILGFDNILERDDPDVMARLLESVALPNAQGIPQVPKIVDQSNEASRGPSLAAIAFAAIHIQHALERLKTPNGAGCKGKKKDEGGNMKKEFNELGYNYMWKEYVRDLAEHPKLGVLRSTFLNALKTEYCRQLPRVGEPLGSDHMWQTGTRIFNSP